MVQNQAASGCAPSHRLRKIRAASVGQTEEVPGHTALPDGFEGCFSSPSSIHPPPPGTQCHVSRRHVCTQVTCSVDPHAGSPLKRSERPCRSSAAIRSNICFSGSPVRWTAPARFGGVHFRGSRDVELWPGRGPFGPPGACMLLTSHPGGGGSQGSSTPAHF